MRWWWRLRARRACVHCGGSGLLSVVWVDGSDVETQSACHACPAWWARIEKVITCSR